MTNTVAKKTPQDRKPSKAAEDAQKELDFSEVEGHELMKPFSKVRGSDQARLTARLQGIFKDKPIDEISSEDDVDVSDLDFDAFADFLDYVGDNFSVDAEKFEEFTCGQGGMERAQVLVMAYVGELGKGKN